MLTIRLTSAQAAAIVAAVALAIVLALAWGMNVGTRDARAMAELDRARHAAACRDQGGTPVIVIDGMRERPRCARAPIPPLVAIR